MSDIYYCAKTGEKFLADWDVRCECTSCAPPDEWGEPVYTRKELDASVAATRKAVLEEVDNRFKLYAPAEVRAWLTNELRLP